ncbi:MAG: putative F0F1-ATPase subunit Ca2+/Mg2+ transporter, partial [Capsulimonas sp.]|nr:putative F0F1-ATPase subunit Ca2+/Mg2+ transporter [Capsulimonas sp.]
ETGDETPNIGFDSHAPLPLPPEVKYTRPDLDGVRLQQPRSASPTRPASKADSDPNLLTQGVQGYGVAITAAITLGVTIFGFVLIGHLLDGRFNRTGAIPWFTICGVLLGAVGGFTNMIRLLTSTSKNRNRDDRNEKR